MTQQLLKHRGDPRFIVGNHPIHGLVHFENHNILSRHGFCLQHVSRKAGADFVLEGSNASAEEADEGTEEAMESGVDLILNHRLVETGFGKKADYMNYLKDYMKRVVAYLESNDKKDQVEGFKKNINGVMKSLLGRFNDLQFFTGMYTVNFSLNCV